MITQISPTDDDVSETMCTLQFASRVKGVELGAAKKHKSSKGNKAEEMQLKRDLSRMESEHSALSAVVARQTSELAAAEASLADLAAQQTTKITGFSSRVSELESRLQSVGEEVSVHKRKAFMLRKECDAVQATADEQAKALKKAKKEKSLSKEESDTLRSKLEATEAKLKRVKKALEREEKKNGNADAGAGSDLAKLGEAVERKGRVVVDLKRRLEEREEQLRASEAKRKALKQRESELIAEHKAALREQTKERDAVKRRYSKTERAMRRAQEEQKKEIMRMQREQRVAKVREERRSSSEQQSSNSRRSSGSARKKSRKKTPSKVAMLEQQQDQQQNQEGRKVELFSSMTPLRIDCDDSSASLDLSVVKETEESGLDQSSIAESMDMSLDAASVTGGDENAAVEDSVSSAAPAPTFSAPPAAPSTSSFDAPSLPTPLRSRTNTPRSSARKKVFKDTRTTPRSAASNARRREKVDQDKEKAAAAAAAAKALKGGILKKSSFAAPTDRAQQLLLWKQQKTAKASTVQKPQQLSRSRKTVVFGPDVAERTSSAAGSGKKRVLTPGRKASRPRASLAKSTSRMSISGKGGSLRKKLSTLGTAVRVRSNAHKAPSSSTKAKGSMGGAVRNSTRRSVRNTSGWN